MRLMTGLLALMTMAAGMAMGQVPGGGGSVPAPGISINFTDTTVGSDGNDWLVTVKVSVFNLYDGKASLHAFNENSSEWDYGYTTGQVIAGRTAPTTLTYEYRIPKNTGWGGDFTDGVGLVCLWAEFQSTVSGTESHHDDGVFYQNPPE